MVIYIYIYMVIVIRLIMLNRNGDLVSMKTIDYTQATEIDFSPIASSTGLLVYELQNNDYKC